jgi:EAL domain-containing protein (putative c-di-GMP-specific phosphodiesterase class I)
VPPRGASQGERIVAISAPAVTAAEVEEALSAGQFRLHAQTILPLAGPPRAGRLFEVLLRLLDRDGRLLSPACFLPVAERHGLMPRIDRWVIGTALAWFARHRAAFEPGSRMALNLSSQSLADAAFLPDLVAAIDRTRVDAGALVFEITETQAIADLDRAARVVTALREMGCEVALDDFGAGAASFQYLRRLPVSYLKAAGMFVKAIDESPVDRTLVAAIHHIGRELGLLTVAESVETPAILARAQAIGIDYAQGWLIAPPAPIDHLLATADAVVEPAA